MLHLRKIEPTDLPFLYQWENDADAWADGANHNPLSQSDLRKYIASTTGDIYRDGQLRLIADNEGEMVGCIDLFDFDPRNLRAAIGMYVAPGYRGKGFGKEMVNQLEKYAFDFLHLRILYAVIGEDNAACNALYSQMGYQPSSLLKNWTLEGNARVYVKEFP